MYVEHYLLDAIDLVLARNLPDELLADAVQDQACLMARVNPEESREFCREAFYRH